MPRRCRIEPECLGSRPRPRAALASLASLRAPGPHVEFTRVELVGDVLMLRECAFQRLPVMTTCFHTRRKLCHNREEGKTKARPVSTRTKWDVAAALRVTGQFLTRGSGHKHIAVELPSYNAPTCRVLLIASGQRAPS